MSKCTLKSTFIKIVGNCKQRVPIKFKIIVKVILIINHIFQKKCNVKVILIINRIFQKKCNVKVVPKHRIYHYMLQQKRNILFNLKTYL